MFANRTLILLSAEKAVKEVVEGRLIVAAVSTLIRNSSSAAVRTFDDGLGVDVDDCRLQLFGNLRELIGKLLQRRNSQRSRRIGTFFVLLAFDPVGDNRPD